MENIDVNYYKKEFPDKREIWVKKVSRTFALSIKILPRDLRDYTGHAYLICRFLDTLEDAPDLSVAQKHEALDRAIESLNSPEKTKENKDYFNRLSVEGEVVEWEKVLLSNSVDLFDCLLVFPDDVRKTIRTWATEMANGMKKYAFGKDKPEIQLKTVGELDEYTYYVAGTVGHLLSEMFSRPKYKIPVENQKVLHENAVQFGKALQLVNIVKDSRADIKEGRCFLPDELFKKYDTSLDAFLDENEESEGYDAEKEKIQRVFRELFQHAGSYLENATHYIRAVPAGNWRIRLGCIWPVVLAYKTLMGLEDNLHQFVRGSAKFKIKKKEVKKTLAATIPAGFSNRYFNYYMKKIIAGRQGFSM